MNSYVVAGAIAFLALGPLADAHASGTGTAGADGFEEYVTNEGCKILMHTSLGSRDELSELSWNGPCQGGYVHGRGTLVYRWSADSTQLIEYTGQAVGGLLDGEQIGRAADRKFRNEFYPFGPKFSHEFDMGCVDYASDCEPGKPMLAKAQAAPPAPVPPASVLPVPVAPVPVGPVPVGPAPARRSAAAELALLPGPAGPAARRPAVHECVERIIAIHRKMDSELKAQRGKDAAQEAARNRSRLAQRDLFLGECSHHPDAQSYVQSAERQLQQSGAASYSATSQPPGNERAATSDMRLPTAAESVVNRDYGDRSRKLHDALAMAHECIRPDTTGLYGGFVNSCGEKITYGYCVVRPRKGSWTDAAFFDCDRDMARGNNYGAQTVGPHRTSANHTRGGEKVLWFACKDGAEPRELKYDGAQIRGKCIHP